MRNAGLGLIVGGALLLESLDHDRAVPTPANRAGRRLSRKERVGLFIHRELDRRLSPVGVRVYRLTRGSIARPWKVDALLLTTRGRRSGKERTVVLQYFPDGRDLIIAAANDGSAANPGWYHNLKATPRARAEVMDRTFTVRAVELSTGEAAAFWPRLLRRSPDYERYLRATARPIPLVRLIPEGAAP